MPKRKYTQNMADRRLGRSKRRKTISIRGKKLRLARIKRAVLGMSELKTKPGTLGEIQLYHDSPSNLGDLFQTSHMPAQGDGENQRIGNKIHLSGIKVKLMLLMKGDRPNVTFKIWVLKVPAGFTYTYAKAFDNISGNLLLDDVNQGYVNRVVYRRTIKMSPTATNGTQFKEWTAPVKFWIPYKRPVRFQADAASNTTLGYQYLMLVGAYDSSGTAVSDNIASVTEWHSLYFRDL